MNCPEENPLLHRLENFGNEILLLGTDFVLNVEKRRKRRRRRRHVRYLNK